MTDAPRLRWAEAADYAALGQVMFHAVRTGATPYSDAQTAAWVPAPPAGTTWTARLAAQKIVVAEDASGIVGFMSLAGDGYVDFAYIRPEHQKRGLFRQLFRRIEDQAKRDGETHLWTHASLMAQPAFSAMGFAIRTHEQVTIGDQRLDRFVMEKRLRGA